MAPKGPTRNPYPVPDVSSEGFWDPDGPVLGAGVSEGDKGWAEKLQPYERLFAHHTLTSIRRDHRLIRPEVPEDALDFSLTAVYTHSEDTMVPKTYVPMQPESLNWETWRVLRNELREFTSSQTFGFSAAKSGKSGKSGKSAKGMSKGSKVQTQASKKKAAQSKTSGKPKITAVRGKKRDTKKKKSSGLGDDDVLDIEQRRLTYAARGMAIERVHPCSIKLAVDGPHSDQTNPGYSRKFNGTFFGI